LERGLVEIVFTNPTGTSKRTQHFTITNMNLLTLFREIIAVYFEKHMQSINKKCRVADC
jgi:hypothetical protein